MIWKIASVVCVAVSVLGDGHATSEQNVKINYGKKHEGHHGELSHIGSHKPEHHEEYAWAYPSYEFSYKVNDPHTHDHKGQHESRHGDEVKGEYWLIEPDGRKRTVKYHADKHSGFVAHVEYSAPHHHVYFKTHKHVEHMPVVEHHHEEHKPEEHHHHEEHKPEMHHHEEHKPEMHHHEEHMPEMHHHHDEPKPVVEHLHREHKPWIYHRHESHRMPQSRPLLRRLEENYHHPRYYRTPRE